MYRFSELNRTISITSFGDLYLACRDLYSRSIQYRISIRSNILFPNVLGSICGHPTNTFPEQKLPLEVNEYTDYKINYYEPAQETPLIFTQFEIPGVCKLVDNVLLVNNTIDRTSVKALLDAVWGADTKIVVNFLSVASRTYYLLYQIGVHKTTRDYVEGINLLPQNPREPIDFEKNIKELFGDKMSNIIMKRMK